jgi:gluconolactonase
VIQSKAHVLRNPGSSYFAVYHNSFLDILGSQPRIELALEKDYPFAHEASVYVPEQDALFITSNLLKSTDAPGPTIRVSKAQRQSDGSWVCEELETGVVMGNGAINHEGKVLFCDQGSKKHPGGLVAMDLNRPYETRTIADSFHGRLFNSVNDVVVHTDGSVWFVWLV